MWLHLDEHVKAKHAKFLKTFNNEIINTRESERLVDNESDDSESELEDLEFDVCEQIFTDESQLSGHRTIGECGFECEDCGVGFKHESQLKSHEEKPCTKCCLEFHPKSVLESQVKNCQGYDYMTDIDLTIPSFRWPTATL